MPERTLALIKSAAVARGSQMEIIRRIEEAGILIANIAQVHLPRSVIEEFYAEHVGRPYFEGLVSSVSGPEGVVVMILEEENVIRDWRAMLGPTDPTKAPKGSIRGDLGGDALPDNAAHGSDSPESAAREIAIMKRALAAMGIQFFW